MQHYEPGPGWCPVFLGKVTLTLLCNNDKNIALHFTLATLCHPWWANITGHLGSLGARGWGAASSMQQEMQEPGHCHQSHGADCFCATVFSLHQHSAAVPPSPPGLSRCPPNIPRPGQQRPAALQWSLHTSARPQAHSALCPPAWCCPLCTALSTLLYYTTVHYNHQLTTAI